MSRIQRSIDQVHRQRPMSDHGLGAARPADLRPLSNPLSRAVPVAMVMAQLVHDLQNRLIESLDLDRISSMPEQPRRAELLRLANQLCEAENPMLTNLERERAAEWIVDEMVGFGPLQHLLDDPTVQEILITGPGEISSMRRSGSAVPSGYAFRDPQHVRQTLDRMARIATGRSILDLGERVTFELPPHMIEATVPSPARPANPMIWIRRR